MRCCILAGVVAGVLMAPIAAHAQSTSLPVTSAAPTAPSAPAMVADSERRVRERVVKLEERLSTQQRDADRLQADYTKLKDQYDGLSRDRYVVLVVGGLLFGLIAFMSGQLKARIEKNGPKVVVDAVLEKLYAEDAEKFTRLFEQHRNELSRVIMARDQSIAFIGEHEDSEQIKEMLKRIGYDQFVVDPAKAKLAIVFCEAETFDELVEPYSRKIMANQLPKRLVLYSAGGKMLNPKKVRELNTWATAIAANMPATAATQLATLAALAQPVK